MIGLRRRRPAPPADPGVTTVVVYVDDEGPSPAPPDLGAVMRPLLAEALILQDRAEDLLRELRDQRDLGGVAPRVRAVKFRFLELEGALPAAAGPDGERLRSIFRHHVLVLNAALQFLATPWPSESTYDQLDRIDGLGHPARVLERLAGDALGFGRKAP